MTGTEDTRWVSGQLRENLDSDDLPALAEAGLLEPDELDYLLSMKEALEPMDGDDEERYEKMVRRAVSSKVNRAIEHGNVSVMAHANGVPDNSTNATGNELVRKHLSREGGHIHLFGPKNSGKTNKAYYYLADVCGDVFDQIWANMDDGDVSDDRIETGRQEMSDLIEAVHKVEGETGYLLDEVSTAMTGYAMNQQDVESQMSQVINATRKYTNNGSVHLVTISHRESLGDVHPIIIENADLLIQCYEGEYRKATLYEGHFDKQSVDLSERKITDMYGIPATSVDYDDSGMAKWWWDAEEYDYRDGLKSLDSDDSAEEDGKQVVRCEGVKDNGERCKTTSVESDLVAETGYCRHHIDQFEDE